mgnify:CR=1 FL=1
MTWDPEGIVVGDAFADYVEDLRETYENASGGGNAHFSDDMNDTTSDEDAQAATTAVDQNMTRRAFAAGVGVAAATAAGAGTVSAQEETAKVPDFTSEYTPVPKVTGARISVENHQPEMNQLDYVDNDGNVLSLTDQFGAVLEPDPENDGEGHNPVTFNASMIHSPEYTAFPRGVTRTNADDEEVAVSALDASEWTTDGSGSTGSISVSDQEDALVVSTSGQTSGDTATASFTNFTIDSGEQRKMLQLVLDVDTLESGAVVDVEVVDAGGASVTSTIDAAADSAAASTIATAQGTGVVHQVEIGSLSGGADLDTLEEIVVSVSEANAAVTFHGMNLELDTEWSFGTREVYDSETDEVTEETLVEPTGRTGIVSLPSLTNQFTEAAITGVEYDVELRASEAPASNWEVKTESVDRGSYESRFILVGGLELPGGLYEVEVKQTGELVDEVRHPDDVYQTVEYAHDLAELPTIDDVEDTSWTDASTVLEGGDMDTEVTISTTVSAGDTIGLNYILTESEEIVSSMWTSAGGGGGPALSSGDGGIMSNLWAWVAALGVGAVGAIAALRRRAASAVPGGN